MPASPQDHRPRLGTAHLVLGLWCLVALVWAVLAPGEGRPTPIDGYAALVTIAAASSGLYLICSAIAHALLGWGLRQAAPLDRGTKWGLLAGHSVVGLAVLYSAGHQFNSLAYLLGLDAWIAALASTCVVCLAVLLYGRAQPHSDGRPRPAALLFGRVLQPAASLAAAGLLLWIDRLPLPYAQ